MGLKRRNDIDGLRAIAVLAVIVSHLNERWLPGGFTGVDVFFVISGYVVTASLLARAEDGPIAYIVGFYARRIRRILPALVACIVATTVLTALFVPPVKATTLFLFGFTALLGMSNVHLISASADYFALDLELNPFAHTWSLGAEEQFYAVFPFLLLLAFGTSSAHQARGPERTMSAIRIAATALVVSGLVAVILTPVLEPLFPRNTWLLVLLFPLLAAMAMVFRIFRPGMQDRRRALIFLLSVLFASLAFSAACTIWRPIAGYYLMPSRLWELAGGAALAITSNSGTTWFGPSASRIVQVPALALLSVGFFLVKGDSGFPVPWALFPVVSTILLIVIGASSPRTLVTTALGSTPMVAIGKISYSLYLWHWPVLSLMRWTIGLDSTATVLLAIALIGFLSVVSYLVFERPFQRSGSSVAALVPLASVVVFAFIFHVGLSRGMLAEAYVFRDLAARIPANHFVEMDCHATRQNFDECFTPARSEARPNAIFVIGDSHAAAHMPMLEEVERRSDFEILQLTGGPTLVFADDHNVEAQREINAILIHLERHLIPGDVVLASVHRSYTYDAYPAGGEYDLLLRGVAVDVHARTSANISRLEENLLSLARVATANQAAVVLVGDVPVLSWSQRIDATLYLKRKRWSVCGKGCDSVSRRRRRRRYGIGGGEGNLCMRSGERLASCHRLYIVSWRIPEVFVLDHDDGRGWL